MSKYISCIELSENTASGKIVCWIPRGSTVLEFGPASGRMTKYLKETLGCRVYIVELNAEDYKIAREYAEDGINGDILDYEWCDRFSGMRFDVILFVDVLEHLSQPLAALSRAKELLKEDGTVILSIPNAAHNDVILSLLGDEFRYTKTGLLDNTHLHFFAHEDLYDFCASAGYKIVKEDVVYIPTFETEQNIVQNSQTNRLYDNFLQYREFGEAYQFVLELQRVGADEERPPKMVREGCFLQGRRILANFYFDTGSGYSENEKRSTYIALADDGRFSCRINLHDSTKRLRFDPTENNYVLLSGVTAQGDRGTMPVAPMNGEAVGDHMLFSTCDPMVEILVPEETTWVKLSGQISFSQERIWVDLLNAITHVKRGGVSMGPAICFFDVGRGFCESDSVAAMPNMGLDGNNRYHFTFPKGVTNIRFDPIEGCGCFASSLTIESLSAMTQIIENGANTASGIVFLGNDPQVRITFDQPVKEVTIMTNVFPFGPI